MRSIVNTNCIPVCVWAQECANPHTYRGICIYVYTYMCTVTTLFFLSRWALWKDYLMKKVILHTVCLAYCIWLHGYFPAELWTMASYKRKRYQSLSIKIKWHWRSLWKNNDKKVILVRTVNYQSHFCLRYNLRMQWKYLVIFIKLPVKDN